MTNMGSDMSGDPAIINTIAHNLGLDPSKADNMKQIMQYAQHWDAWRWCFWIPAILGILGALWLFVGLRDDPRSVGLPELPATNTGKKSDDKVSRSKFLKAMVWTNRWIWTLCFANIFVYVMRMGILDWGPKFLTEARHMSLALAAISVTIFEVLAIVGTIAAGWCTDHIFKGKAHRMCLVCMVGAVTFLSLFIFLPDLPFAVSIAILSGAGFFIYGPQALIGIAEASATANGLAGIFGYVGSFVSAIAVGIVADAFGWNMVFYLFIAVGIIGALTFVTMWNAPRDGYERSQKFYAAAESDIEDKAAELNR